MTREEIRERAIAIKNPIAEYTTVYELLDELGITYKKTTCHKCRIDLYNILREEVGLIDSAADNSEFNEEHTEEKELPEDTELVFIYPRPVRFGKLIVSKDSSQKTMMKMYKAHPKFFLVQKKLNFEN